MLENFRGAVKRFFAGPAEFFFRLFKVFRAEGGTVAFLASDERGTVPDTGMTDDNGRLIRAGLCFFDRGGELLLRRRVKR